MTVERKVLFPNVLVEVFNQSVLSVIPRHKYAVRTLHAQPTEVAIHRNSEPDFIIAPYGTNEAPVCTCIGVDTYTRETCRMVLAYGGTCGKPFADLQKANQEYYINVVEVPLKDQPKLQRLIAWSVLAGSKIVSVVKRAFNFLRGNK